MFSRENVVLLVIDVQERLLPHINESENLVKNILALTECCKILNVPGVVTEQYPEGIGPTIAALASALEKFPKISKRTFSCCREPQFMKALKELHREQIIIVGIETHVCVFQTSADLIRAGYAVQIVSDAVGARTFMNKKIGLDRIKALGAEITSVESAVFELLETSACPEFKQVLRYLK